MAPRGFDRYMVKIGLGTHPKLARLTDGEVRAHVLGVLAVAAMAPIRGCLLVGQLPAEAGDIAPLAGVPTRVAAAALRKLEAVGILERDAEHHCLRVHDWDDINPSPGAERTRRWRDGRRDENVTLGRHASGTEASPEVEVEVEASEDKPQKAARAKRRVDQSQLPEAFPTELQARLDAVLPILSRVWKQKGGLEPQLRGVGLALMREPRADHVDVALKLEHWLSAGRGQRAKCADVTARFGDWVQNEGPAMVTDGRVVPIHRSPALEHADRFKRHYPREAS